MTQTPEHFSDKINNAYPIFLLNNNDFEFLSICLSLKLRETNFVRNDQYMYSNNY